MMEGLFRQMEKNLQSITRSFLFTESFPAPEELAEPSSIRDQMLKPDFRSASEELASSTSVEQKVDEELGTNINLVVTTIDEREDSQFSPSTTTIDEMMEGIFQQMGLNMQLLTSSVIFPEDCFSDSNEVSESEPSYRDQILKPKYRSPTPPETYHRQQHLNNEPEANLNFDRLFTMKDSMNYHSQSRFNFTKNVDGAITSEKIESDAEGCRHNLTTREFGGQKYEMLKVKCPGGKEYSSENLTNLTAEELPGFLSKFH